MSLRATGYMHACSSEHSLQSKCFLTLQLVRSTSRIFNWRASRDAGGSMQFPAHEELEETRFTIKLDPESDLYYYAYACVREGASTLTYRLPGELRVHIK